MSHETKPILLPASLRALTYSVGLGVLVGWAVARLLFSLVEDVLLPPVGMVLGKVDFANLFVSLSGKTFYSLAEAQAAGAPLLRYEVFLTHVLAFVLVLLVARLLWQRLAIKR
ncbi:MAG: hypothetical protein EXR78_02430 [Deltaproteobacteria bacterium]|nr:hypothetical protein [Deltaproteobacteria bacterium]